MAWSARSRKTRRFPRAPPNGASLRLWPPAPSRKTAVSTLPDLPVRVHGFTRVHLETEPNRIIARDNEKCRHLCAPGSRGFKVHAGPTHARVQGFTPFRRVNPEPRGASLGPTHARVQGFGMASAKRTGGRRRNLWRLWT